MMQFSNENDDEHPGSRRAGEIYANALIEKEKDDLTEGDQGESRGNIKMKRKK